MNVATAIDQNPASFDLEGEEARIAEANRRLAIVESFLRMLKGDPASGTLPMAPRAAYSKLKQFASRASVDRYVQKYQASGGDFNALIPGTDRCGRTSMADKLN
jgi:glutaredoxin 2